MNYDYLYPIIVIAIIAAQSVAQFTVHIIAVSLIGVRLSFFRYPHQIQNQEQNNHHLST